MVKAVVKTDTHPKSHKPLFLAEEADPTHPESFDKISLQRSANVGIRVGKQYHPTKWSADEKRPIKEGAISDFI